MAYNSATESFEARSDSSQNFTTVLSGEALCTQGGNDLFKKATNNNLNFAVGELPSTDDLMKQLYEAKGQPLYDKAEKTPAPHDEDKPQLKGWDDVIKAANEAQHKIAESAKKDPDVKKVTETHKPGEKIETVIVERKDGSVTTYKPDGTVERKPAHGELKHEETHQKSHPPEHKDQKAPQHKDQDHKAPDHKAPDKKATDHKTPERKPAAKLPYALPGNARLEDWLE